ncbi:unnamed protein product [Diatraea saccharalis]|uniref:PDZ domain-containing protein n=1 Tax=Diatraea saccharalis TaxID=40085 RepID=A0A9P0C9D8_9NEOP|nr:unnamed protein product [Diatraea saccharalis]
MPMYQRPPFWRVPHQRPDPDDSRDFGQRRRVTPGTPAGRELLRGDIIAKIDDYDARDLRHEDAQNLFKNASNQIRVVIQRDVDRELPAGTPQAPRSPIPNYVPPPYRTPSPMPASGWRGPESLPRSTPVPHQSPFPQQHEGEYRTLLLSPTSTRTDDTVDESIQSQPYRTTPLVLPGAKVRREPGPTESYLRHHPNPAMRAPPHHDYRDTLMKQKVAESVLQRVVGDEGNKMVHKQFNSPINLYSDQNIANSIRQQSSPLPALQEDGLNAAPGQLMQEVPTPVTPKVFTAPTSKRPAPTPKPAKEPDAKPKGKQTTFVNSLQEEHIQQSNSFKRLMYNVLGDTEF